MNHFLHESQITPWRLVKFYWQSENRLYAYSTVAILVCMIVFLVALDVALSYWANYFYDALQAYNMKRALYLVGVFMVLATCFIIVAVYRYYISQLFGLRWRRWLTKKFLNRWLEKRDYYYLENFDKQTDNPDQRIQEDISLLVTYSISLFIGLITAVTTIVGFIYVLWQLSGTIQIHLGPLGTLYIPGYLVWVSIIYSLIGTAITFKIGRPLVDLNFEQQRREATFRFAAIDLRAHAENVALYNGEVHQKSILERLFGNVLENWYAIILRQKLLLWFTAGYNQIAVLLPLLVALPNYFSRVFQLGGLMQSLRAFTQIQDAMSFLVNAYTDIAQWRAVNKRLITFVNHMNSVDREAARENELTITKQKVNKITAKDVIINTPAHIRLLTDINEEFIHGQHYLIQGPSGIGKSTFVRAVAGIWPYAAGSIQMPDKKHIMYLPQKSYMPIGTLTEAILFPDQEHPEMVAQLQSVLHACRLDHLVPRLKEVAPWSEQLSPGEQQRVAFARVLLHKPDWVFLDESTSMLDLANEKHLYQLMKTHLPHCSIVSVGHRPSLQDYHDQVIDLAKYSPA